MACDMSWEKVDEVARESRRRFGGSEEAMVAVPAESIEVLREQRSQVVDLV